MMKKKKILFISHDASLAGAPILVLNLLKRLQLEKKDYIIDVLLIRNGELYEDFAKVSNNIFVVNDHSQFPSFINRNLKRLQSILFQKKKEEKFDKIIQNLLQNMYDLVYGNTIDSLIWTLPFYKKNIPTILAVHELTFGIESIHPKEFILENLPNVTQIIAGSKAVAENLIDRYSIDKKKIKIIHSFVDNNLTLEKDKESIKKELGISNDNLIIGIASAQELRKGTDLVPLLVKKIEEKTKLNFKFINLGGNSTAAAVRCSKLDAEKLEVENKIIYVDHNRFPSDYINAFDIFLLLSREDPFPLVMLTAAKLKKPIIAFEKSGGAVEFLEDNHGILIPFLDLDIMTSEIVRLFNDKELRNEYGNKIYHKLEKDYSDKKLTKEIFDTIENLL